MFLLFGLFIIIAVLLIKTCSYTTDQFFILQLKSQKRRFLLCLSSTHAKSNDEYQASMHRLLPCKRICSKDYQHGTLFALELSKQTLVGTMDKMIQSLQTTSNGVLLSSTLSLTSISDTLSGKIKSFGIGKHMLDEHYSVIYASDRNSGAREPIVNPDVNIWYPETSSSIQTVGDDNIGNDEEVEEATEEKLLLLPNPSNAKKRASTRRYGRLSRCFCL